MIQLVLPHIKYKDTYIEAVKEFQTENNRNASNYLPLDIKDLETDFQSYVKKLHDQITGTNLPKNLVPATEYWIIDNNNLYLGRLQIRHELNDYLLKAGGHIGYNIRKSKRRKGYGSKALEIGLIKAKELGLDKILVTCDDNNIPSIKIIEKYGGKLENKVLDKGILKKRYWIKNK